MIKTRYKTYGGFDTIDRLITNSKTKIMSFLNSKKSRKTRSAKKYVPPKNRPQHANKTLYLLTYLSTIAFVGAIVGIVLMIFVVAYFSRDLPNPNQLLNRDQELSTKILDRNGEPIYQVFGEKNRSLIQLTDISPNLRNATVAVEDASFYTHKGFDLKGMLRAVRNTLTGEGLQGGSTLTQQVVKNALLTQDRTLTRKIKEFILSVQLESRYSKDEILQMYLNETPYGGQNYGVLTASRAYFNKSPKDLTLAEAAYIAGLPQRPSVYSYWSGDPQPGLESYGIPSKNNIVDITNYVMVELGQPMHAQDIDAMEKPEIVIRRAKTGEKVTTLLGETVELDETMFVLTQNDKPTVIGGVVGGASTGVTEKTVNIVLDSGNYDQTNIRRTSRKLKIQNETVLRYDKFLHPKNSQIAIERATQLILELAGGEYYENYDYYPNPWPQKQMTLRLSRVEKISGVKFELERVKDILSRLEYKILEEIPASDSEQASLKLEIPHFRTDIEVEDDIVADVLRINNYNKLPVAQINAVPPTDITPKIYVFEDKLRDACVNLGMHEHITTPLVKATTDDPRQVLLENALNSEQNALRTQLYDGLYDVAQTYNKHNMTNVALFEVGIKYTQNGDKTDHTSYKETRVLQVYIHTDTEPLQTSYTTKQYLAGLFNELGITNVTHIQKDKSTATIKQNDTILGELKYDSFFLYTKKLMEAQKTQNRVKTEFTNVSSQDITITMNTETPAGDAFNKLTSLDENIDRVEVVGEYFESDKKSVTFRIFYTNKGNIEDKIAEFKNNSN